MELEEVLDICNALTPDAWKSDKEYVYDNGRLRIVSLRDDYLGDVEVLASFDGKQFLWYRENYANTRYVKNRDFEDYLYSNEFAPELAKQLLIRN